MEIWQQYTHKDINFRVQFNDLESWGQDHCAKIQQLYFQVIRIDRPVQIIKN